MHAFFVTKSLHIICVNQRLSADAIFLRLLVLFVAKNSYFLLDGVHAVKHSEQERIARDTLDAK